MSYDELILIITKELRWGKFDQYTGKLEPAGMEIVGKDYVEGWCSRTNLKITRNGMKEIHRHQLSKQ